MQTLACIFNINVTVKVRKTLENNKTEKISQLVQAVKNNDTPSFVELLGVFSKTITFLASGYHLPMAEFDDLCQEGRIALYRAAMTYDESKNAGFSTYATVCMTNAMVNFVNKYNASVSGIVTGGDDAASSVEAGTSPEDIAFSEQFRQLLSTRGFAGLSETERKAVFLKVCGYKTAEICEKTGKSAKSVDNTLFRARKKLRSYIDGTK